MPPEAVSGVSRSERGLQGLQGAETPGEEVLVNAVDEGSSESEEDSSMASSDESGVVDHPGRDPLLQEALMRRTWAEERKFGSPQAQ